MFQVHGLAGYMKLCGWRINSLSRTIIEKLGIKIITVDCLPKDEAIIFSILPRGPYDPNPEINCVKIVNLSEETKNDN